MCAWYAGTPELLLCTLPRPHLSEGKAAVPGGRHGLPRLQAHQRAGAAASDDPLARRFAKCIHIEGGHARTTASRGPLPTRLRSKYNKSGRAPAGSSAPWSPRGSAARRTGGPLRRSSAAATGRRASPRAWARTAGALCDGGPRETGLRLLTPSRGGNPRTAAGLRDANLASRRFVFSHCDLVYPCHSR